MASSPVLISLSMTIVAYVTNKLHVSRDTISIHWHGMHQRNTPWMDGVGGLSHCPITPGTTFTYIFKASPSGTFWYHSHSGTQRTDGLFGALIVKEKVPPDFTNYSFQLSKKEYTLSLLDWQHNLQKTVRRFTWILSGSTNWSNPSKWRFVENLFN